MLAADGTPLKQSLARSLRRQKFRAFLLVAPLLLFVIVSFIAPIADMLFRSVENQIVPTNLPRITTILQEWDPQSGELPDETAYQAIVDDILDAAEQKNHTKVGQRLNYETSGISRNRLTS